MTSACEIAAQTRSFDLGAGNASTTLREFAKQAKVSVVMDRQNVLGVQTNEVSGLLVPSDALTRMLEGTPLVFNEDLETGAFAVTRSEIPSLDQTTQNTEPQILEETEMKPRNNNWLKTLAAVLTIGIAGAQPNLSAQEDDEDEIFDLSPFTVSDAEDSGYLATQSLGGTRIKTNLRDVAASISVITKQFLEDTNVTRASELLIYTAGTETAGTEGNYPATGNNVRGAVDTSTTSVHGSNRFRALAAPDYARDYFETSIPFDTYNVSRVELNRGANSVLFGLGSPAGILNYNLFQPSFQNKGEVQFRMDEHGSFRTSVDFDRELIEDKLAIRIALLSDNTEYKQEPAYEHQDRIFGALTWNITDQLTFRGNVEHGTMNANRPRPIAPSEAISPWILLGNPIYDLTTQTTATNGYASLPGLLDKPIKDGGVPWTFPAGNTVELTKGVVYDNSRYNGTNRVIWQNANYWQGTHTLVYSGPNVQNPDSTIIATDKWYLPSHPDRSANHPLDFDGDGGERLFFWTPDVFRAPIWGVGIKTTSLQDRRAFDFVNNMLGGDTGFQNSDFTAANTGLSLVSPDNTMGIDVSFDYQETTRDRFDGIGSGGFSQATPIFVDLNRFLAVTPGGLPTDENSPQSLNPNYLRPFVTTRATTDEFEDERRAVRATGFIEFDFEERMESGLGRWLGRHVLTGVYSTQTLDSVSKHFRDLWTDPQILSQAGGNLLRPFAPAGRAVYLGPAVSPTADGFEDFTINRIDGVDLYAPGRFYDITTWYGGVQPGTGTTRANGNTPEGSEAILALGGADGFGNIQQRTVAPEFVLRSGSIFHNSIDSYAINLQSHFIDDLLVGTVGYREDEVEIYNNSSFPTDDLGRRIMDDGASAFDGIPLIAKDDSLTWSVVGYVPDWIKLPGESRLSFHYGESENFEVSGIRVDELGNQIPNPAGDTQEYGFVFSTADNRFVLKVNRYETNVLNQTRGLSFPQQFITQTVGNALSIINDANTGDGSPSNLAAKQLGLDAFEWAFQSINPEWSDYRTWTPLYDELGNPLGQDITGGAAQGDTEDRTATGTEVELVFNPTSNWRIALNVAKQDALSTNLIPQSREAQAWVREWLYADIPGYSNLGLIHLPMPDLDLQEFYPDRSGADRFVGEGVYRPRETNYLDNVTVGFQNELAREGVKSSDLRELRWNFITNYQFTEGKLQGFGIGGAARYQDEQVVGYAELASSPGLDDVSSPYYGESETNYDLWFNYKMPFFQGKVDWISRLTIRNITADEDDFILLSVQHNGQPAQVRYAPQRTIYWSNTFKF